VGTAIRAALIGKTSIPRREQLALFASAG
jgi:hypothetical protein